MKKGIIIQARLGSSRLPHKVLLPIVNELNLLQLVINRLRLLAIPIVVATTDEAIDDELVAYLENRKISYYRGSEYNVLERFIGAAEESGFDSVIRVCADNPLLDIPYLNMLVKLWDENPNVDYLSYSYKSKPTILTHFGVFAECVSLNALRKVSMFQLSDQRYIEHVTYGVYSNPSVFNVKLIDITDEILLYDGIRLTVDTESDYLHIREVYNKLTVDPLLLDFREVAEWIRNQPILFNSMKNSIIINKK